MNIIITDPELIFPVDEISFHLITDYGVVLVNLETYTINTITFDNSQDAIDFINNF